MFKCFVKWCPLINLDLFWKQSFLIIPCKYFTKPQNINQTLHFSTLRLSYMNRQARPVPGTEKVRQPFGGTPQRSMMWSRWAFPSLASGMSSNNLKTTENWPRRPLYKRWVVLLKRTKVESWTKRGEFNIWGRLKPHSHIGVKYAISIWILLFWINFCDCVFMLSVFPLINLPLPKNSNFILRVSLLGAKMHWNVASQNWTCKWPLNCW